MTKIAIVGGGITGVTSAYALTLRGFDVTLFERHRYAAMETSFANGGQLSASNAEVWNHPSTLLKGLKWIMRRDAPLLVNPRPTWHKLSWFSQFIANIPKYEQNTQRTAELAIAARQYLFDWARAEDIDFDFKDKGILHIYRDRASFEHAQKVSLLLARGGLIRHPVTPEEMKSIEPTLAGTYYGGFYTPSDSTGDIHKFTNGLAKAIARRGVKTLYEHDIEDIDVDDNGVRIRATTGGATNDSQFDRVVVCAGTASRKFANRLGDSVNVYPVKGYSITVNLLDEESREGAPEVSLLDDATKLVTSRLGPDRFRVAGTAEFNGLNKNIRADRIEPLIRWVRTCFPKVNTRSIVPWAGLRPMMPDMMPKVGRGRSSRVYYNTGHGHLGWTLSAATAEMLADAMTA
jgi:D-amino-acid dehydrogenase